MADAAALLKMSSRARIRIALRRRLIVRDNRGRYSLPGVDEALRAANALSGLLAEDSAAQYYGWEVKIDRHHRVWPFPATGSSPRNGVAGFGCDTSTFRRRMRTGWPPHRVGR